MTDIIESSGNVFADLGLDQPEVRLAKAELAARIAGVIRDRDLTQKQAAEMLGLDQPKISALVRGKLSGFTIDRLLRFLADLGCDVEINVHPPAEPGAKSAARVGRICVNA
jgi:predicted XRE-type DNA-binding protein